MKREKKPVCFTLVPAQNRKISALLQETFDSLQKLYARELPRPVAIIVPTRASYDRLLGRKTETWVIGTSDGKKIYLLSWEAASKCGRDWDSYSKVVRHEYVHVAYRSVTGHTYPRWVNEGLACHLAGQNKKDPTPEEALTVLDYFEKSDSRIYAVGTFWIRTLVKKFGMKKLLALINALHGKMQRQDFERAFFQTYGFKFTATNLKRLITVHTGKLAKR